MQALLPKKFGFPFFFLRWFLTKYRGFSFRRFRGTDRFPQNCPRFVETAGVNNNKKNAVFARMSGMMLLIAFFRIKTSI